MAENRMFRYLFVLAALGTALSGCGRSDPPPYENWATESPKSAGESSGGFELYAQAAREAEAKGEKYLTRVSFFPDQRKAAANLVTEPFRKVIQGTGREVRFPFAPHKPFTLEENHRGWRLIGRVFAWKVEDSCKAGDYGSAVMLAVAGTKFGFDLTGGGALDADLGLSIADDVRVAIAPHLEKMGENQLQSLASGMATALKRLSPAAQIHENERQNMRLGVQEVQDAYQKNELENLEKQLGPTVKEAIDYLRNMRKEGEEARVAYFRGFAAEADAVTAHNIALSEVATLDRRSRPPVVLATERPWRRLARHFFDTQPLIQQHYDSTLARTRILIISATFWAQKKQGFPHDLSKVEKELATDPYTGQRFLYHYDSAQFSLYSVGSNLKDDGGESDATFSSPDLVLEKG